jgi:protein-S-isoprenylcysteine O-methyltransferase Ste14
VAPNRWRTPGRAKRVLGSLGTTNDETCGHKRVARPAFLTIVTHGPFRLSRNPIYLANSLAYLGLTLVFNTPWPLLLILPMLAILYWGIIRREERYLEAKFGEPYLSYKACVRRWI